MFKKSACLPSSLVFGFMLPLELKKISGKKRLSSKQQKERSLRQLKRQHRQDSRKRKVLRLDENEVSRRGRLYLDKCFSGVYMGAFEWLHLNSSGRG